VSRSTFITMPPEPGIEPGVARFLAQSRANNARRGLPVRCTSATVVPSRTWSAAPRVWIARTPPTAAQAGGRSTAGRALQRPEAGAESSPGECSFVVPAKSRGPTSEKRAHIRSPDSSPSGTARIARCGAHTTPFPLDIVVIDHPMEGICTQGITTKYAPGRTRPSHRHGLRD
jgi:hypothetical protein